MRKFVAWFCICCFVASPAFAEHHANSTFTPSLPHIKSHLSFLADDLLEGRDTGSRGHEIASLYIANEFAKYGLTPMGTNGYMQRVSFRQALLDQSSPALTLNTPDGPLALSYPKDYITSADIQRTNTSLEGNLIFVGYGIEADELGHNDYEGLDVEGKVVVILAGKPAHFPSEAGAHLASGARKSEYAVKHGAIGIITVTTPTIEKVSSFQNRLTYIHMARMRWIDSEGQAESVYPEILGSAYFSAPTARKLFAHAPMSIDDIYAQLDEGKTPKGFDIPVSVKLTKTSQHKIITSPNVAGAIEGGDPVLKDEYIVFTAHSDHTGFAKTVKKDKINNGAMDNASGTSVMLETARLFSQLPDKPKRSILFLAVTGEERGLLGADYFAKNPTVPIENIVANVNLDMPILTYNFADVIAFGANHSDMKASVEMATANVGLALSPDPWPEQALFTRSDHYAFVKQGVPAVFLVPGFTSEDPEVDGGKAIGEFLSTHYHKPSDDLNLPFNWAAAEKFTLVNAQIGYTLANQANRTAWNSDSFFSPEKTP